MYNTNYGLYAQGFGLPNKSQTIPAFTHTETEARQRLSGLSLRFLSSSLAQEVAV